jgi:hypothetical protein
MSCIEQLLGRDAPSLVITPPAPPQHLSAIIPRHNYRFYAVPVLKGHAVAQLVEALCYKSEGSGFDSRRGYRIFQLT